MKYIKLFAVALSAFIMSACSDSKDYNTASDVTVEMEKSEISIKEHVGRFVVPVKITGTPNGDIKVKVKVDPSGNNPAKPFEESNGAWIGNYIVTSDVITISADDMVGNIEIYTVDDKEINEDRSFIVTIESAEGASVGLAATTLVIIKDNDSNPYERVQGSWSMTYYDFNNAEQSMSVSLSGYDEDSKKFGVELTLDGMYPAYATDGLSSAQVYFFDDESIDMRYLEIIIPQTIGTYSQDSTYLMWLIAAQRTAQGSISMTLNDIVLTGIISEDYNTITFDEAMGFAWYFADSSFDQQLGALDAATDIVMKR
ncbi:MAG: hypothetical protein HDR88_16000 [Bacteroides sp.]|nr:hypothetical protein [Bacteroides sp.]